MNALRLIGRVGPLARHSALRQQLPAGHLAARARLCTTGKADSGSTEAAPAEGTDPKPADATAEADAAQSAEEAATTDGADVAALEARVAELDAQVTQKHDQMLRALADADNARRRATVDVENAHKFGVSSFAKELLDVADNLARAAESVPEEMRSSDEHPQLKALYEGVVMTDTLLIKAFGKHGVFGEPRLPSSLRPRR